MIQLEKRSVASIVNDFGVSEQTVRNWLKQNRDSQDSDKIKIAQLEAELKAKNNKIADHEMTIEILKKSCSHPRPEQPEIVFKLIKENRSEFPVVKECQIYNVSRSGYYAWDERDPSKREKDNAKILEIIKQSYLNAQGMIGLDKL